MVTATVLAIFWVPLFYVAVSTLFKDEASKQQASVEKGNDMKRSFLSWR